jgi:hypothetical protein
VKTLLILTDPSYGTERGYSSLRLAKTLAKDPYVWFAWQQQSLGKQGLRGFVWVDIGISG